MRPLLGEAFVGRHNPMEIIGARVEQMVKRRLGDLYEMAASQL
jgi:hypothetical protein